MTTRRISKSPCWQGRRTLGCAWSPAWATTCCVRRWPQTTVPVPSWTSPTSRHPRSSRPACRVTRTRSRRPGSNFLVSGAEAPRDATLREIFGDLAPVAVIHGENSATPAEVVPCPGQDSKGRAGDWTAMIGSAEELAARGIKRPGPARHALANRGCADLSDAARGLRGTT